MRNRRPERQRNYRPAGMIDPEVLCYRIDSLNLSLTLRDAAPTIKKSRPVASGREGCAKKSEVSAGLRCPAEGERRRARPARSPRPDLPVPPGRWAGEAGFVRPGAKSWRRTPGAYCREARRRGCYWPPAWSRGVPASSPAARSRRDHPGRQGPRGPRRRRRPRGRNHLQVPALAARPAGNRREERADLAHRLAPRHRGPPPGWPLLTKHKRQQRRCDGCA